MSQNIPESFRIDFSGLGRDLPQEAVDRLLSQFLCAHGLHQLVLAFMGEVQCLYDAIIDMQERRTLYMARGGNMEALGRIVGQSRAPRQYSEAHFMAADRAAQGPDVKPAWSAYAPTGRYVTSDDTGYGMHILARIAKNHTLMASVPELENLTRMITGWPVSFDKTGPMQVSILVPQHLSLVFWNILTQARSDTRMDHKFMMPYPATLWFSHIIVNNPERPENLNWFCADRTNLQRCDRAPCAVGVPFPSPEDDGNWVSPDDSGGVTVYLPENWLCADRTTQQRPDIATCAVGVPIKQTGVFYGR